MSDPAVSVVMAVLNEADDIGAARESALRQNYAGDLEVIVADGGSDDGTREIIQGRLEAEPRLRLIDNPAGTTPAGLNAAIRASSGEVIVRLDGRSVLPPGYIGRAVSMLDETGADNVGGVQAAVGGSPIERAIAAAMSSPVGVGDSRFHSEGAPAGWVDTVYLGVFRRESLERIGLFDEAQLRNQDYELNHRLRETGPGVFFDPELRVEYRPRSTIGGLWRQYLSYGAWKRRMVRNHPGSVRWRQAVPPLFVIAMVVSAVLLATPLRRAGMVLPAAYAALVVGATLLELARRRDASMLILPVVFPAMHMAWGIGFLAGQARAE